MQNRLAPSQNMCLSRCYVPFSYGLYPEHCATEAVQVYSRTFSPWDAGCLPEKNVR